MRLAPEQIQAIKEVVFESDPDAEVFLFGSRVNDLKRGGDIDLLILSAKISLDERRKIKLKLFDQLGPQKIDLIIAHDESRPFVRIVQQEGVRL